MAIGPKAPQVSSGPNINQLNKSFGGMLNTLYGTAPQQYGMTAQYEPQYTALAGSNLGQASGSYLDTLLGSIIPGLNAGAGSIAGGNANTLAQYAPATASAINGISPGTTGLMDQLLGTTSSQLGAAATGVLPANQADATMNAVNGNWASRGMGGGTGNQLDAAMQYYMGGENNLNAAEGAAGSAIGEGFNTLVNPTLSTLTPSLTTPGMALGATGTTASGLANTGAQGSSLYSTGDLESLMNSLTNQQASAGIENANMQAAKDMGEEQFFSGLIGSM